MTNAIIAEEGRDPAECLSEFLPILKNSPINITHNGIRFDIPFLVFYAQAVLGWKIETAEKVLKLFHSRAYDTAVWGKATECYMERYENEPYLNFAKRVMDVRSTAKFNLGFVCDKMGIDRSKVIQHRALGDVFLTHEIYKTIHMEKKYLSDCCNAVVFESPNDGDQCSFCHFSCLKH